MFQKLCPLILMKPIHTQLTLTYFTPNVPITYTPWKHFETQKELWPEIGLYFYEEKYLSELLIPILLL